MLGRGGLRRLGGGLWPAMVGKLLPYTALFLFLLGISDAVLFGVFEMPLNGSRWVLIVAAILFILACQFIGALLALLMKNTASAVSVATLVTAPAFGFMGIGFPRFGMNAFSQGWGALMPGTWFLNARIDQTVRGAPLDLADTVTYQGMMFTGVPNLVWVFGYFRASWTLRVEMIAEVVCRMLHHMDETGRRKVVVELPPELAGEPQLPWVDPENFNPGYLMRDMHLMPRRLDREDWQHTQDYWSEKDRFAAIDVAGRAFRYE